MATLKMFKATDMTLIDKQDYNPQLHQKPLAWEDLRVGEMVVVTVIGAVPVALKANVVLGITSGIALGGQANHEVDVIASNLGDSTSIVVFGKSTS